MLHVTIKAGRYNYNKYTLLWISSVNERSPSLLPYQQWYITTTRTNELDWIEEIKRRVKMNYWTVSFNSNVIVLSRKIFAYGSNNTQVGSKENDDNVNGTKKMIMTLINK